MLHAHCSAPCPPRPLVRYHPVLANFSEGVIAALNDLVDPQYLGAPVSRGDLVVVLSQQLEDANNGRVNQLATFLWQLGVVLVPGTTRATIKFSRDVGAALGLCGMPVTALCSLFLLCDPASGHAWQLPYLADSRMLPFAWTL